MTDLFMVIEDMVQDGGTVEEDVEPILSQLGSPVDYLAFLKRGEEFISSDVLRGRAIELGVNFGWHDA